MSADLSRCKCLINNFKMRVKRTDGNQLKLMQQIRALGFQVVSTHEVGKGFPDLVMCVRKQNILLEVKDPSQRKSDRKLTPAEEDFHKLWEGPLYIVETIEDIIKITNL